MCTASMRAGATVRLNTEALGLRVAELDGQLPRLRQHPELLLSLAAAYHRIYPDRAPLVRLILARDGKLIRDRKVVGTIHRVVAEVERPMIGDHERSPERQRRTGQSDNGSAGRPPVVRQRRSLAGSYRHCRGTAWPCCASRPTCSRCTTCSGSPRCPCDTPGSPTRCTSRCGSAGSFICRFRRSTIVETCKWGLVVAVVIALAGRLPRLAGARRRGLLFRVVAGLQLLRQGRPRPTRFRAPPVRASDRRAIGAARRHPRPAGRLGAAPDPDRSGLSPTSCPRWPRSATAAGAG